MKELKYELHLQLLFGKIYNLLKLIIIISILIFIFNIIGNNTSCIIKNKIGLPCPSCGMSRALMYFIKGDMLNAFYYHPLFIIPLILPVMYIFSDYSLVSRIWKLKYFWVGLGTIIISVYAIRMYILFPNIPPMDFKEPIYYSYIFDFLDKLLKIK